MALKIVGVKAVVQDFSKFMNQLGAVTKATTDSTKRIILYLEREAAVRRRLEAQVSQQYERYDKFVKKEGEVSDNARKVAAQIDLLINSFARSALRSNQLTAALSSSGSIFSKLGGIIGKFGPIIGAAALQFKLMSGYIKFLQTPVRVAVKVITSLTKAIVGLAVSGIQKLIPLVVDLGKKIVSWLVSGLKSLLSIAGRAAGALLSGLGNAVKKLTGWVLELAKTALRELVSALREVVKIAWEGAATFQKLEIRFQGLAANEILAGNATMDFDSAMRIAAVHGAELLNWVQQLALTTPFTRKDVGDTVAFSMAMGFTSDQAKILTTSIGNFVSGMGLSSDVMERIILQFGQMQAGGKLFGTELRDLARGAFVPVNDILEKVAERFEMTADEWRDLAARGETDIMPFFEEFINMANTRFPDAMERMNKTLEATIQNVQEFVREIIGVRALGPTVDAVAERLGEIFKQVSTPETQAAFENMGRSIELLTFRLFHFIEKLTEAIFGTADFGKIMQGAAAVVAVVADRLGLAVTSMADALDDMETTVGQRVIDAFYWGVNLAANFAAGIVEGINKFLIWAMKQINVLLSRWLFGASPPLVAPGIKDWGAAVLTRWLEGFSDADFTVLQDVTGPLGKALDILMRAGFIGEDKVRKIMLKVTRGLIEGLSMDQIGAGIYGQVAKLGTVGKEINDLIRLELQLAAATETVKRAEEALERTRRRYTDAIVSVAEETAEYNRMLRGGEATDAMLRAQLARVNAAEQERNISEEQIGVAEENLQVAQDALEPIQEQVRLQQQLIDQLIEIMGLEFPAKEMEKLGKAVKGVGDAFEGIGDDTENALGDLARFQEEADILMRKLGIEEEPDAGIFGSVKKAVNQIFDDVEEIWNSKVGTALETLKTTFETFKQTAIAPLVDALVGSMAPGPWSGQGWRGMTPGRMTGGGLLGAFSNVAGGAGGLASVIWGELQGAFNYLTGEGGAIAQIRVALIGTGGKGDTGGLWGAVTRLMNTLGLHAPSMDGVTVDEGTLTSALGAVVQSIIVIISWLTTFIGKIDTATRKIGHFVDWMKNPYVAYGEAIEEVVGGVGGPTRRTPQRQHGAWRTAAGLARLHENEMILPASIASQVRSALTARVQAAPTMSTTNYNNQVTFGDVSVGSQVDMAMLGWTVERALVRAAS